MRILPGEQARRLDERLLPLHANGSWIRGFDSRDASVSGVAEYGDLGVLHDLRGKGEVVRRKRRTIVPADVRADRPRRLHRAVGKELPLPVLRGGDGLCQLWAKDVVLAKDAETGM